MAAEVSSFDLRRQQVRLGCARQIAIKSSVHRANSRVSCTMETLGSTKKVDLELLLMLTARWHVNKMKKHV